MTGFHDPPVDPTLSAMSGVYRGSMRRDMVLRVLAGGVVLAGVAVAATMIERRRTTVEYEPVEPLGPAPEERRRTGTPADRGKAASYGLKLDLLRNQEGLEPVVQYLTFIQRRRGDESHLLFVRYDDLDAMAAIDGQDVSSFLQRLDQLGVVVSNN